MMAEGAHFETVEQEKSRLQFPQCKSRNKILIEHPLIRTNEQELNAPTCLRAYYIN